MSATAAAAAPAARPGAPVTRDLAPEVRVEVRPPWPFRLPRRNGMDGLTRTRNGVLHRLLHVGDVPVVVRVAQPAPDRVLFGARCADRDAAATGDPRMRRALGVDLDLRPFYARFRSDPLIGASVRADPALRVTGRPEPFEALAWAVCEQLIEYERAASIQRRLIARLGRRCAVTGLRDSPAAAVLAGQAPALLASFDLAPKRALTLIRVAREVAAGRVDLDHPDHERGWRRLRAISGVGSWTLQSLALAGQGRMDQIPAGDLGLHQARGAPGHRQPAGAGHRGGGRPLLRPYAPWAGLAGLHALRSSGSTAAQRLTAA